MPAFSNFIEFVDGTNAQGAHGSLRSQELPTRFIEYFYGQNTCNIIINSPPNTIEQVCSKSQWRQKRRSKKGSEADFLLTLILYSIHREIFLSSRKTTSKYHRLAFLSEGQSAKQAFRKEVIMSHQTCSSFLRHPLIDQL